MTAPRMTDGLEAWQAQIAACRADRPEAEECHWQRVAQWYDRWGQQNDYVETVLPRLMPLVQSGSRVLEIGPGTGAFTLALARRAGHVVAVEPSAGMRQVLTDKLAAEDLQNVTLVPQRIEDAVASLPNVFDLALASHSLYNVLELDMVLRYLLERVRHSVILMGTGYQQPWLDDLYRRFRGRPAVSPAHYGQFAQVLEDRGIAAEVEILHTSANYIFEDVDDLVAWWAPRLGVAAKDQPALRRALLAHAERRNGQGIGIYGRQRVALIQIDAERRRTIARERAIEPVRACA